MNQLSWSLRFAVNRVESWLDAPVFDIAKGHMEAEAKKAKGGNAHNIWQ
jgi:hypothetical protein